MRFLYACGRNHQKNTCKVTLQASCLQLHYLKVKILSQVHSCVELYLEIKFLILENYQWVHFIMFVFYKGLIWKKDFYFKDLEKCNQPSTRK